MHTFSNSSKMSSLSTNNNDTYISNTCVNCGNEGSNDNNNNEFRFKAPSVNNELTID